MVYEKIRVLQNLSQISRALQSSFLSNSECFAFCNFLQSCFGVKVLASKSKDQKILGLTEKNAGLAVSQSLALTIHHSLYLWEVKNVQFIWGWDND